MYSFPEWVEIKDQDGFEEIFVLSNDKYRGDQTGRVIPASFFLNCDPPIGAIGMPVMLVGLPLVGNQRQRIPVFIWTEEASYWTELDHPVYQYGI